MTGPPMSECYFCGEVKKDVEPFLPGMFPTCPGCFKKAMLWGLNFSAAWERELKKKEVESNG